MRASARDAYAVLRALDLSGPGIVRAFFLLRLLGAVPHRVTIDDVSSVGFALLAEKAGRSVVLGTVGRFWSLRAPRRPLPPDSFASFEEPGWAKAALSFEVEPEGEDRARVLTETRVRCTDERSRRAFRRYWLLVGPFSALIRRLWLREIRRLAERLA